MGGNCSATWGGGLGMMGAMSLKCALCFIMAACVASTPWRNCGTKDDIAVVSRVKTFQDAQGGKYAVVAVQGNLTQVVGDGKISINKYKDDLLVGEDELELCCEQKACPMYTGAFNLHKSFLIPTVYERGAIATFQMTVKGTTFMKDLRSKVTVYNNTHSSPVLFCIEFDFPVQRGAQF